MTTPETSVGAKQPSEYAGLEALRVETGDGTRFVVRLLPQPDPSAPVVLLLPAMAMKAKFYLPFAKALHACGLSVALCDLRAHGESTPALREGPDFGYRELIEVDLPAVTAAVRKRFTGAPLHLFGHSLGGQIAILHTAAEGGVDSVTVIGTGTVFWWAFGPRRWLEALGKIQWIGLVATVKGWWPGGVLIPGAMAGGVMRDWARHSRTGRYRPRGTRRDYDRLVAATGARVLLVSLDEDTLGPRSNVDFLARRLRSAQVARWHVGPEAGVAHRDHFQWIKDSAVLGPAVSRWITEGRSPGS